MSRILFVTGTDTGVGKTVLTAAMTRWLRRRGVDAVALKPLASGDREDARALEAAMEGTVALDRINPWAFAKPIAPLLAARLERRRVTARELVEHVRETATGADVALVEGAGGLLSPLLDDADAPELIEALRARPVVVAANELGVVNRVRLVCRALPKSSRRWAQVVLMDPEIEDESTESNRALLGEYVDPARIHVFPRMPAAARMKAPTGTAARVIASMVSGLGLTMG